MKGRQEWGSQASTGKAASCHRKSTALHAVLPEPGPVKAPCTDSSQCDPPRDQGVAERLPAVHAGNSHINSPLHRISDVPRDLNASDARLLRVGSRTAFRGGSSCRRKAPRALTPAACLARSADRAGLWLSAVRAQRSTARSSSANAPTLSGPTWHSRRPHQRHCGTGIWRDRDIAAGWRYLETPCASLPTRSPSQPRTAARKAGVLDPRKQLRERDRLSAGGRRIRTLGPP